MFNKDKRTLVLSMLIGDGNIHVTSTGYSKLTIDHGLAQADYQSWKASLLSFALERNVKVRTGHKGKSIQLAVAMRRFKAWYKFCYKNKTKDIPAILKWTNNPWLTIAIWLMDDGYVERNGSYKYKGEKFDKVTSARMRLFTCDQTPEQYEAIIEWFKINLNVTPKVAYMTKKSKNITYPYLKIDQADSLKIWEQIREKVLTIKSMQHKFRHLETVYQFKKLQNQTPEM